MSNEAASPDIIDESFVPVAKQSVASVELEGEGLLYDEERGSWHLLSSTAMVIWQCCDGSATVETLALDLAQVYQVDLETVRIDTLEAVRQLGRQGLLAGVLGNKPDNDPPHAHDHDHHHEVGN